MTASLRRYRALLSAFALSHVCVFRWLAISALSRSGRRRSFGAGRLRRLRLLCRFGDGRRHLKSFDGLRCLLSFEEKLHLFEKLLPVFLHHEHVRRLADHDVAAPWCVL